MKYAVTLSEQRAQSKDIPELSRQFYDCVGAKPKTVLPFYVVSRDYDAVAGAFPLFLGDDGSNRGLEQEILPAGLYAKLEYELHTEKSIGKHPSIDLLFAIRRK